MNAVSQDPIGVNVVATVQEVLPKLGIAYLADEKEGSWAVTRSTKGPGLESLVPGQKLRLLLDQRSAFGLVREYRPGS
jgi:hypothetical protein